MRRKFTVYGLRFSKTTFWNRLNTGFLDPAVCCNSAYRLRYWNPALITLSLPNVVPLQQYLPFTVLKLELQAPTVAAVVKVATVLTVYGIETKQMDDNILEKFYQLQQHLPLAVLKHFIVIANYCRLTGCNSAYLLRYWTPSACFMTWSATFVVATVLRPTKIVTEYWT